MSRSRVSGFSWEDKREDVCAVLGGEGGLGAAFGQDDAGHGAGLVGGLEGILGRALPRGVNLGLAALRGDANLQGDGLGTGEEEVLDEFLEDERKGLAALGGHHLAHGEIVDLGAEMVKVEVAAHDGEGAEVHAADEGAR